MRRLLICRGVFPGSCCSFGEGRKGGRRRMPLRLRSRSGRKVRGAGKRNLGMSSCLLLSTLCLQWSFRLVNVLISESLLATCSRVDAKREGLLVTRSTGDSYHKRCCKQLRSGLLSIIQPIY